jgi:hypothetical protein
MAVEGPQHYGFGDGLTLMGLLLCHHSGEIEVRMPTRRRQRPDEAAWGRLEAPESS